MTKIHYIFKDNKYINKTMTARLTVPGYGSLLTVGTTEVKLDFTSTDEGGFLNGMTISSDGDVVVDEAGVYSISSNLVFEKNGATQAGTIIQTIKVNDNDKATQPFSYNVNDAIGYSVATLEQLEVGDTISVHAQNSYTSSSFKVDTSRNTSYLLIHKV